MMQLRITWTTQDALTLPLAYQHQLQSMIYAALDAEFAAFLHNGGYLVEDRTMKLFTFGRLHSRRYAVNAGTITFFPPITLEIRSPDPAFIRSAVMGFAAGTAHYIRGQRIVVASCELINRVIRENGLDIVMDSPITVYSTAPDGRTRPYAPNEPQFPKLIGGNAERKWLAFYGTPMPSPLRMTPIQVDARNKVVTQYKGFHITAWLGRYRLEAPAAVLDLLYNAGLGADSPKGFGMFRKASSPLPNERTRTISSVAGGQFR